VRSPDARKSSPSILRSSWSRLLVEVNRHRHRPLSSFEQFEVVARAIVAALLNPLLMEQHYLLTATCRTHLTRVPFPSRHGPPYTAF
jgi:hypothetical protein